MNLMKNKNIWIYSLVGIIILIIVVGLSIINSTNNKLQDVNKNLNSAFDENIDNIPINESSANTLKDYNTTNYTFR